jgi:ECF transporter S component (folate family)
MLGGMIMKKQNTKRIVHIALLIAIEIVLTRFCSISTPFVRIGFGFLPVAIAGMLYGPLCAGVTAAAADFLGAVLFPIGAYFPGFTVTAFLTGVVYGAFLHKRSKSWVYIGCAVLTILLGLNLGLDTVWLWMITGKGYIALLPLRILKCVLMIPVQVIMIRLTSTKLSLLGANPNHV